MDMPAGVLLSGGLFTAQVRISITVIKDVAEQVGTARTRSRQRGRVNPQISVEPTFAKMVVEATVPAGQPRAGWIGDGKVARRPPRDPAGSADC